MDPLTQTLIGAAAAHAVVGTRRSLLIGGLGGLLPDADVFIRSASDPLLAIEMHRQFTHSLIFIPVGGLIAAIPWMRWNRNDEKLKAEGRRQNVEGRTGSLNIQPSAFCLLPSAFKHALAAGTIGWATHGLLDACTTYGTQLLWPFSKTRIAWHCVSILDPFFTVALVIGVVLSLIRRTRIPVIAALVFCLAYLGLGVVQRNRALDAQEALAQSRGHARVRGEVYPTVGNRLVWRSLYEDDGNFYSDRIRVASGSPRFTPGMSVREYRLPAELMRHSRIARDFARFRWFASGWVAADPRDPTVIGDVRYSLRTDIFEPVWGVRLFPDRTEWVDRSGQRLRRR